MIIKFRKLIGDVTLPSYLWPDDAGLDLIPVAMIRINGDLHCYFGFAVEIPDGFAGFIFPWSSVFNYSLSHCDAMGVIVAGYRGEVKAVFRFSPAKDLFYAPGVAVARMIILPVSDIQPVRADILSETSCGAGG